MRDFSAQSAYPLRNGFKLERQLPALSTESLDLRIRRRDFVLQTLRLAIHRRQAFLCLRELVAQLRSRRDHFYDGSAASLNFALESSQIRGGRARLLLAKRKFVLRSGKIRCRRFQNVLVRRQFLFQRRQTSAGLTQFCVGRSRARHQFRAALFVRTAPRMSAVDLQGNLVQAVAVLPQLSIDRITPLRAFPVLALELLHHFGVLLHFFCKCVQLSINFGALHIQLRELAGQHHAQLGAHLVAQLGIALGFGGLPLQRVHLPRDFLKNVIHAVQVELGVFQACFRQPLLRFELRDPGRFFNNGAAIRRTAGENLPDASLLDQRIRLRPQARSHEQFLNVAQTAQLAIE